MSVVEVDEPLPAAALGGEVVVGPPNLDLAVETGKPLTDASKRPILEANWEMCFARLLYNSIVLIPKRRMK